MADFFLLCFEFFKHLGESIDSEKIELRYEDLLKEGPEPLTLLAIKQHPADSGMIQIHRELTYVLHLMSLISSMKYPKTIESVFDECAYKALFKEINRFKPNLPDNSTYLNDRRYLFLKLLTRSSMDLIRLDYEEVYVIEHVEAMQKFYKLAEMWNLDIFILKKHQIVCLYVFGWDQYAEQLLDEIDGEDLGNQLLQVLGYRLFLFTEKVPKAYLQAMSMGNFVSQFLDEIVSTTIAYL